MQCRENSLAVMGCMRPVPGSRGTFRACTAPGELEKRLGQSYCRLAVEGREIVNVESPMDGGTKLEAKGGLEQAIWFF